MSGRLKLGYIGLGNQGAPMAKRYLDWPGGLTVFDVRAEAMEPFTERGATAASSLAEVADADLISITVLNDAQVRDVITGDGGLAAHAKPGTVIAIHSTISHTTAVELAEELEPQGIHIADAPVSGGAGAAAKGELAHQGAVLAVGVGDHPCGPVRRGDEDEAGAKHADVHHLYGRGRGAEACGRGGVEP
jgi:3-hydroxyisobutyrate dehydrogenase-like beta-hydroxyacid dehydrogenase